MERKKTRQSMSRSARLLQQYVCCAAIGQVPWFGSEHCLYTGDPSPSLREKRKKKHRQVIDHTSLSLSLLPATTAGLSFVREEEGRGGMI